MAAAIVSRVVHLRAERFNIGEMQFSSGHVLSPQAHNLPEVLNKLQANPVRFERYNRLVAEVFPHIRRITVQPVESGLRILVWSVEPSTERDDLAMPLSESGTGIGQVLAMLYLVVTADDPRIILIDEPQSFLHPGALRTLLRILRTTGEHQYIVTTHSPIPLTDTEPSSITVLKNEGNESSAVALPPQAAESARAVLSAVGARLSDVFGYDAILWVEGRTEEVCFPRILGVAPELPLRGIGILGIVDTGPLERGDGERIAAIYQKLSTGGGLMPPVVAILIDRERRSQAQVDELGARTKGMVRVLDRCMFENYLLIPAAIAHLINLHDEHSGSDVSPKAVSQALEDHGRELLPNDHRDAEPFSAEWYAHVDGARLIALVVSRLSDARVQYDKVRDGELLTQWIAENEPGALSGLVEILRDILRQR